MSSLKGYETEVGYIWYHNRIHSRRKRHDLDLTMRNAEPSSC